MMMIIYLFKLLTIFIHPNPTYILVLGLDVDLSANKKSYETAKICFVFLFKTKYHGFNPWYLICKKTNILMEDIDHLACARFN